MISIIRLRSMIYCHHFGRPYGCSGFSWIFSRMINISTHTFLFRIEKLYSDSFLPEKVAINNYLFNTPKYDQN